MKKENDACVKKKVFNVCVSLKKKNRKSLKILDVILLTLKKGSGWGGGGGVLNKL